MGLQASHALYGVRLPFRTSHALLGERKSASDFTALRVDFADEILNAIGLSSAWPELLRRVARELGYDDRDTLRQLRNAECAMPSLLPLGRAPPSTPPLA